jgi:hypothetical protein
LVGTGPVSTNDSGLASLRGLSRISAVGNLTGLSRTPVSPTGLSTARLSTARLSTARLSTARSGGSNFSGPTLDPARTFTRALIGVTGMRGPVPVTGRTPRPEPGAECRRTGCQRRAPGVTGA